MNYQSIIAYFSKKITKDNITAYAAQAALFIILSVIPFLLVFVSLIRYTPISQDTVVKTIHYILPGEVSPWVASIVKEVYTNSAKAMIITVIFAVYSSAKCIHSLRNGLNEIYEVKETRNWFKLRARAMIETFLLILGIILVLILVVFGEKLKALGAGRFTAASQIFDFLLKGRLLIIFVVLTIIFAFIYKAIPNHVCTFRSQLVGAIGCTAAWYVFSFFLSIAIRFFNGFSLYGSLTTIVIVAFWLDICMIIFFACGEVNYALEMIIAEFKRSKAAKRAAAQGLEYVPDEEDPFEEKLRELRQRRVLEDDYDQPAPSAGRSKSAAGRENRRSASFPPVSERKPGAAGKPLLHDLTEPPEQQVSDSGGKPQEQENPSENSNASQEETDSRKKDSRKDDPFSILPFPGITRPVVEEAPDRIVRLADKGNKIRKSYKLQRRKRRRR
ncbi:MAG: YhjD/YihY/BrkB family envelope integrity protein [Eubacterium sp.]|jgi:membrane protein